MNKLVNDFVEYVISEECPRNNKDNLVNDIQRKFSLIKDRKVLYCNYFAVRVSYTKTKSFSNTVLSLSCLQKYDDIPFFVVLVSATEDNKIFLANSTFLTKISHSSQKLSLYNIKGSFNGSDIIKTYDNIENNAENFEKLFAYHKGLTWEDNLQRLVDATSNIVPINNAFEINTEIREKIYESVFRAKDFVASRDFILLSKDFDSRVKQCNDLILVSSRIENVNIRGRLIEALVTTNNVEKLNLMQQLADEESKLPVYNTKNGLGDYNIKFSNHNACVDIKTKIIYLDSNPKAYNIDKFLKAMSDDRSIFLLYFIGIDKSGIINTVLCSVYHTALILGTKKQPLWSGRNSRGSTQFIGKTLDKLLNEVNFTNEIDIKTSKDFIDYLINID